MIPALPPHVIALQAAQALRQELAAFPKPGLVSFIDHGSHPDMDADCFLLSIEAIAPHFASMAESASRRAPFADLQQIGIAAEHDMLRVTQGRNTHRGAIFCLGLLAAAAGTRHHHVTKTLGEIVREQWGSLIPQATDLPPDSMGIIMCQRHAQGGVRQEAASGFPTVYEVGLPALRDCSHRGTKAAHVQTFFALMEHCEDTTLLKRGGREGMLFARQEAARFLRAGGVNHPDWLHTATCIHQEFVRRNLTVGGAADLLAATLFVENLEYLS